MMIQSHRCQTAVVLVVVCVLGSMPLMGQEHDALGDRQHSITDRRVQWPTWDQWKRVFLLQDYNTRVVVFGTTLLGMAGGLVGSFALLRKRALMGDALSHATLPGIGLAFILATYFGMDGKSLPVLLSGAAMSGVLGVAAILAIRNMTRLKEDAALGIVLSVFFGIGVGILGVVQQMKTGHAAGLEGFVYGKTASMRSYDAWLIGGAGFVCMLISMAFFKELKLICFDETFAGSRGYPVLMLDMLLMALVVVVTIIGLQAVGLILMIALLVIPAAAARFWTENMQRLALYSSILGAICCLVGASFSAIFPRLPSGAMIVLTSAMFFMISMILGSRRGVLVRVLRRRQLNRAIDREHLLRGIYELLETQRDPTSTDDFQISVSHSDLLAMRSWSPAQLGWRIRQAEREGLVQEIGGRDLRLTPRGYREAARLVHQHRLWEMYLLEYAEIAPSKVDRQADAIEHVLDSDVIAELETLLLQRQNVEGVPVSPHRIGIASDADSTATSREVGM